MNFRITTLFFGLLLTTLFVFGLMIAQKKNKLDQEAIIPTLKDGTVKSVVIKQAAGKDKPAESLEFVWRAERWYYQKDKQEVRVEGRNINEMVSAIRNARQEETLDLSRDLGHYGLNPPQLTVVLSGTLKTLAGDEKKEWTFFVGKDSPDGANYYVNSSEKNQQAYAVPKRPLDGLFVANVNTLRSKRLFDFMEPKVKRFEIVKGKEDLEIKRDGQVWTFIQPKLGFIGTDAPEEEPEMPEDKFHPKPKAPPKKNEPASGVKALLTSIKRIVVDDTDDFVPLGKELGEYGLDDKSAPMKIDVHSDEDPPTETLLIGKKVPNQKETFYYARLSYDQGVFKLNEKHLKLVEEALANPGDLRSRDVAAFDPKADKDKRVDYVHFKNAKDEVKFFFPEHQFDPWEMFLYDAAKKTWEKKKANNSAVTALVEHLVGKKAIVDFLKLDDADKDKKLAEWGLKKPSAEISVFANAIDRTKKDEPEEVKKDDKGKKDEPKKDEPKKDKMPHVKEKSVALVKLEFGNLDKDGNYYVRRTLESGVETYFKLKKEFLDKIAPPEGVELAYLDTELPAIAASGIMGMKLQRTTDKGAETIELERQTVDGKETWYVKDSLEKPSGLKLADGRMVATIVHGFADFKAKKWLRKFDAKEDLDKLGLKSPGVVVTLKVKKVPEAIAAMLGAVGEGVNPSLVGILGAVVGHQQNDKAVEFVTIEFGKEDIEEKEKEKGKDKEKEKIKLGTYAKHSKSDLLFLVDTELVKALKDVDLRDRAFAMNTQGRMIASYIGITAGDPTGALMFLSPHITGQIHDFDPAKVKEVRLTLRTPIETRSFFFERAGKGKDATWFDRTPGLFDFHLDSDKVAQLVKDFSKLRTDRFVAFVGGQRGEHKLGPKEFTLKLEFTREDGPPITVLVGTNFQNQGYYATSSYWPESETVFMIPAALIDPLVRGGAGYFAKDRLSVN